MPAPPPQCKPPLPTRVCVMLNSVERSNDWGLADGIRKLAFDRAGAKIPGYK